MDIQSAKIVTDFSRFNQLRQQSNKQEDQVLANVSKEFEALFFQQALKSMRQANESLGGGLFNSNQMDLYNEMFDQQLSMQLAEDAHLGFYDLFKQQFNFAKGVASHD